MSEPQERKTGAGPSGPPARRVDVARDLLRPHLLRDSLALVRQPSLRNSALAGAQSALAAAIALPLIYLSPWPHLIGFAALGTLVALFGRFAPERRRSGIVLLCALLQIGTVFVMSAAAFLGLPVWALLVLLAIACGVLFFVSISGRLGAPGAPPQPPPRQPLPGWSVRRPSISDTKPRRTAPLSSRRLTRLPTGSWLPSASA